MNGEEEGEGSKLNSCLIHAGIFDVFLRYFSPLCHSDVIISPRVSSSPHTFDGRFVFLQLGLFFRDVSFELGLNINDTNQISS